MCALCCAQLGVKRSTVHEARLAFECMSELQHAKIYSWGESKYISASTHSLISSFINITKSRLCILVRLHTRTGAHTVSSDVNVDKEGKTAITVGSLSTSSSPLSRHKHALGLDFHHLKHHSSNKVGTVGYSTYIRVAMCASPRIDSHCSLRAIVNHT